MAHVRFNPELTLGNAITILVISSGIVMGWGSMNTRVEASAAQISKLDQRVTVAETKMDTILTRMAEEKVQLTTILTELQTDVRYLRAAVDELKQAK